MPGPESRRAPSSHGLHSESLWLSRPPYLLLARVLSLVEAGDRTSIDYELYDYEGDLLMRVCHELDGTWWNDFQPLVRREG